MAKEVAITCNSNGLGDAMHLHLHVRRSRGAGPGPMAEKVHSALWYTHFTWFLTSRGILCVSIIIEAIGHQWPALLKG